MSKSSAKPTNAEPDHGRTAMEAAGLDPRGNPLVVRDATPAPRQPVSEAVALMQMMERIAKNKDVDVAKMREVKEMGKSLLDDQRRTAFDDALAQMQGELPTIGAKGRLEIREKDAKGGRNGPLIQSTPYAKWDDINEAIKPVLKRFGFGLRFKTGLSEKGLVTVTGILSGHGHREETTLELQHDATGSKNAVQAVGSSTSYGKRYAACALLNITTHGEDDDGAKGGGKPLVSDFPGDKVQYVNSAQITHLMDECKRVGCPTPKFLDWANVATFEEIPMAPVAGVKTFEECLRGLAAFEKKKK